jgi:hypothetical protein
MAEHRLEGLVDRCRDLKPMLTGVVHPCSADAFRVHHFSCPQRAREACAELAELGQQTDLLDLLESPGRRCGCWPTSPFLFSRFFFADSGRTMELGRSG